jgi:hypothetical protein
MLRRRLDQPFDEELNYAKSIKRLGGEVEQWLQPCRRPPGGKDWTLLAKAGWLTSQDRSRGALLHFPPTS